MYTVYQICGGIVKYFVTSETLIGRAIGESASYKALFLSTGSSIDLFRFPISGRYIQFIS